MQTFLPYPDFRQSAACLDYRRLGKQRVEGVQILKAIGLGEKLYTEFLHRAAQNLPIFWGGAEAFPETAKWGILSPRLKKKFSGRSSWEVISTIRDRFEK